MMQHRVILTATSGRISGVDIFSIHLVRGLLERGIDARIVLTMPDITPPDPQPFPPDIPLDVLPVHRRMSWRKRWQHLQAYLQAKAPCIYIPNYDWNHSGISPLLPPEVVIVGIVHSDDPRHYEHVVRLGAYWNLIIAVSQTIARRTLELAPEFKNHLRQIPYGVPIPDSLPSSPFRHRPDILRVVYAGRLVQHQKRVLDLPRIVQSAHKQAIPLELTIIGDGEDRSALLNASAEWMLKRHIRYLGPLRNDLVLRVFAQSDVFILPSEFEGLPVSLLEAMGQGCVPIVSDVRSGIPELIQEGSNGFRLPVGDTKGFVRALKLLHEDISLRQSMSEQAYRQVREGGYQINDMIEHYLMAFQQAITHSHTCTRPHRHLLPPPELHSEATWRGLLPRPIRALGFSAKQFLMEISPRHPR